MKREVSRDRYLSAFSLGLGDLDLLLSFFLFSTIKTQSTPQSNSFSGERL